MKPTKFTPGPWTVAEYAKCFGIKAVSGRQIAIMTEHHGDEPNTPMQQFDRSKQDAADAALISCAPELYAALESLYALADVVLQADGSRDCSVRLAARQALAKARGES